MPTETIQAVWEYLGEKTYDMAAHTMARYRFAGPTDKHGNVVFHICPTGFAMIYNHSDDPNIKWAHDTNNRLLVFTAIKDIKRGEELCHDYGYKPNQSETSEITV